MLLKMTVEQVKNRCELRWRDDEQTYYAIEKDKIEQALQDHMPTPRGVPIPAARVKTWAKYIIQYDPFSWENTRMTSAQYMKIKEAQRRAKKYLEAKQKEREEQESQGQESEEQ